MRFNDMKDDEILKQYLLGRLKEEQADTVEERLLKDGDFFELAEAMEGDLFAAAARGELSPADRAHVRWWLAATPEGRARYALASGLVEISREAVPAEDRIFALASLQWVRAAVAAASVAFMAGGLWLGTHPSDHFQRLVASLKSPIPVQTSRPSGGTVEIATQDPTPPPTPTAEKPPIAEQEPAAQPELAPLVFQLALQSLLRSPGDDFVQPPMEAPGTRPVDLQIALEEGESATSFVAVLKQAEGEVLYQKRLTSRKAGGRKTIVFSLPAATLAPGAAYTVEIRDTSKEEGLIGYTTFTVASS